MERDIAFIQKSNNMSERSDKNGLRWHMLTAESVGKEFTYILAATCIDGIGVIVRWCKVGGSWEAEVLDTESQSWGPIEENDEIPLEPPTIWDDKE